MFLRQLFDLRGESSQRGEELSLWWWRFSHMQQFCSKLVIVCWKPSIIIAIIRVSVIGLSEVSILGIYEQFLRRRWAPWRLH